MKRLRYARPRANFVRVIRVKDMDRLGISHKGEDLVFSTDNGFEIVMSNKMSESLVDKFPGEFLVFDSDAEDEPVEVPEPMTSLAQSASSDPQGEPESSQMSFDDVAGESTRKRSKNS